mgnify:CR=1 FL=1
MAIIEVCTTVMGKQTCVEDTTFAVALVLELAFYFLVFVLGHRIVLWMKKENNK